MSNSSSQRSPDLLHPSAVRYIKLGEGGRWEHECREKGIIRIGFGMGNSERFRLCQEGRWEAVKASFLAETQSKGTATNFTHQVRAFFEDDGTTLWLTFIGERLYWGMLTPTDPAEVAHDGKGVQRVVAGGWRWTDRHGEPLTKDQLSGALTQLAAFRGTSCRLRERVHDYAIRRINGQKVSEVEEALQIRAVMEASIEHLTRLLEPRDFELLVDLVFSASGWQRLGVVGKTTKTLDIDLLLPSTGERAFVQVKSTTTQAELDDYIGRLDELDGYDRMFYVFHTHRGSITTDDERVTLIGASKLAEMVLDAGLVNWLIRKVS